MDGVAAVAGLIDQYNAVMAKWSEPDADYDAIGTEQAALEDRIAAADAWNLERNVDIAMDALRCPPDDADVTTLSGGEKRRVALARLLLSAPTSCSSTSRPTTSTPSRCTGSSASSRSTPARSSRSPTIGTSSTTWRSGSSSSIAAAGSRSKATTRAGSNRSWPDSRARSGRVEARQRTLARELEWVRLAPRARQAKGKARLGAYEKLLAESQADKDGARALEIAIPPGPRLGDSVIDVSGLSKAYGDKVLIEDLTFSLPRAGIVGVIGPERRRQDDAVPDAHRPGAARLVDGSTSATPSLMSYVDQSRDDSPGRPRRSSRRSRTASSIVRVGAREVPARAYVSSFNFRGTDQQKPVGKLSGGERNRVHLAKLLNRVATCCCSTSRRTTSTSIRCERSEAGLESFPGCAVVISHDRWFLDRIATHVLAFEGDSQVRFFQGNFTEYEEFRHRELGTAADQPHRIRYKRLGELTIKARAWAWARVPESPARASHSTTPGSRQDVVLATVT